MYTHIIGHDDEVWDILEDSNDIQVNSVGRLYDIKSLTPEYIKITDKSTAKTNFKSLCATYEGNQQVQ